MTPCVLLSRTDLGCPVQWHRVGNERKLDVQFARKAGGNRPYAQEPLVDKTVWQNVGVIHVNGLYHHGQPAGESENRP